MKMFKIFMSLFMLFLSTVAVSAESMMMITPKAFAYIWPTHYRIYVDELKRVYYQIDYQEIWLSSASNYATDSCELVYNYSQPPFVPVPVKKILSLAQVSFDDLIETQSLNGIISTDWACTVRYQNTVRLGDIVYTVPYWK